MSSLPLFIQTTPTIWVVFELWRCIILAFEMDMTDHFKEISRDVWMTDFERGFTLVDVGNSCNGSLMGVLIRVPVT